MECCAPSCCDSPQPLRPVLPMPVVPAVVGIPSPRVTTTHVQENVTYRTRPIVQEQVIEVPQVEYRDRIVEDRRTMVVEKVVHVPRTEVRERVVEVPRTVTREVLVDVPQIQVVEKIVEVPTPVFQEKIIPIPRPIIQEKVIHVPRPSIQEKIVDVPRVVYKPVPVEKIVEVPDYRIEYKYRDVPVPQKVYRHVPVDRVVHVPQVRYVEKIVKKPVIRSHSVPVERAAPFPPRPAPPVIPVSTTTQLRVPVTPPPPIVRVTSAPAPPVVSQQGGCCDTLAEGLFGCFMPPVPVDDDLPEPRGLELEGTRRHQLRLVSPRHQPINMDLVVMPRNTQRRRRNKGLCSNWCVPETSGSLVMTPRAVTPLPTTVTSVYPAPVKVRSLAPASQPFRNASAPPRRVVADRFMSPSPALVREVSRTTSVPLQATSTQSLGRITHSAGEPMIETKMGVMPFREFEKLNNDDAFSQGRGRPVDSTAHTPTTQVGSIATVSPRLGMLVSGEYRQTSPAATLEVKVEKTTVKTVISGGDGGRAERPAADGESEIRRREEVVTLERERRRQEEVRLQGERERVLLEWERLANMEQEKQLELLGLQAQQQQVHAEVLRQQAAFQAEKERMRQEQERMRTELRERQREAQVPPGSFAPLGGDVLVQTRFGPMRLDEFERANNANDIHSLPVASNTINEAPPPAVSRAVLPPSPRLYAVGSWYGARPASQVYTSAPQVISNTPRTLCVQNGPFVAPVASPIIGGSFRPPVVYQPAPLLTPRRVIQPACVHTSPQFVPMGPGPVMAISPRAAPADGILDDQYKNQVMRQAQTAAQNAYRAGVSVYQSVRDVLHREMNGTL